MNTLKQKVENAINDIVFLLTLPPQIDYVEPYVRKAEQANLLLASLPKGLNILYHERIQARVDEYFTPSFQGENGKFYSAAELDAMF